MNFKSIQNNRGQEHLTKFVESLPLFNPKKITEKIYSRGYIGQEQAVKAISLMAFRHISRLKKLYIEKVPLINLPPKVNMLFVGPTGCGKTFLIEILFKNILKLPTAIVDMTCYSETGYVGQDVTSILTRLLYSADLNPLKASVGIICLDEFDKIASGQNNAVFAGAGTTKDVSGLGVQRELLKMLESSEITISTELSHSDYAPKTLISTENIPFIACGAFSGLKGLIDREGEQIGFGRKGLTGIQDNIAVNYTINDVETTKHFLNYGLLPELIGRFKRILPFNALNKEQLKLILKKNIIKKYKSEFSLHNIKLIIKNKVLDIIIDESIKKETGARGIESSLLRYLENAAYEAYSTENITRLELYSRDKKIEYKCD